MSHFLAISLNLKQFYLTHTSGATTVGPIIHGSCDNKGVVHIPQSSCITQTFPSDCLVSYQDTHWWVLTPPQT